MSKEHRDQGPGQVSRIAVLVLLAVPGLLSLVACTDQDDAGGALGAGSWPSGLTMPIPGATLSLDPTHFPGYQNPAWQVPHRGFKLVNGFSGRPFFATEAVVAMDDGVIVRIDHAHAPLDGPSRTFLAELSREDGFIGDHATDRLLGRQVWIRHESGHVSRYAQLSEVNPELAPGAKVSRGQQIATISSARGPDGGADSALQPGLHFELWSPGAVSYLGEGLSPAEAHRVAAGVFGREALPAHANALLFDHQGDGPDLDAYPPPAQPAPVFEVNPPSSVAAGSAFAIPIRWDEKDFSQDDFFASLDGQSLGLIDAGNGAWILGAAPLDRAGEGLRLDIGAVDDLGRTVAGQSNLTVTAPVASVAPRVVAAGVLERHSLTNRQIEATRLSMAHSQSLEIARALWSKPFMAPLGGDVVGLFGQPQVFGVLQPDNPLPGVEIEAREHGARVLAANAGIVAVVDDLPIRGKTVALVHGGGVVTVYTNLGSIEVAEGDRVEQGQVLGTPRPSSEDRRAVGIEVHVAGVPSNPADWLNRLLPLPDGEAAD